MNLGKFLLKMASETDETDEFYESGELQEIHAAIVNDNLDQLQEICSQHVDVNEMFGDEVTPEHYGMTALGLAAALDRLDHVKVLLDHGADINSCFANLQTTALMTASFHGHVDVVSLLLENGADPRAVDVQGSTALGYCFGGSRSIDVISLLLRFGMDVNQKNMLGMNALLLVVGYGNDFLTRMILESGADSNSVNDFGHSALHLTVVGKRSLIGNATHGRGMTSLYGLNNCDLDHALTDWARGHSEYLPNNMINDKQLEKASRFMIAVGQKMNEPPNFIYSDNQEAMEKRLHAVAQYRDELLNTPKNLKKAGVMDTLLSCGGRRSKQAKADVSSAPQNKPKTSRNCNSADVDRDVAALSNRCARIIKFVLDAACDVHKTDFTYGLTALDMALVMGDVESTVMLLAAGGDPDHLFKLLALTDLFKAITTRDKKLLKDLLSNDPYLDVNGSFESCNVDMSSADDGENKGDIGLTPLAVAAKAPDNSTVDIIKMLMKKGADVNVIGMGGRSPLGEACRWGNKKMVEFLLNQGANLEASNPAYKDATAVSIAVICKQTEIVEYLISKGAKIDRPMNDHRTSLIKALDADDMPMIDTLLEISDLDVNFYDRSGFLFHMAEKYKQPNRDIEWILHEIRDHSKQLEEYDKKTISHTVSNLTSKEIHSERSMNSAVLRLENTEQDDDECGSQNSQLKCQPVSDCKIKSSNFVTLRPISTDSSESSTEAIASSLAESKLPQIRKLNKNASKVKISSKKTKEKKTTGKKIHIDHPPPPAIPNATNEVEDNKEEVEIVEPQPKLQPGTDIPLLPKAHKPTKQKKTFVLPQSEQNNNTGRKKKTDNSKSKIENESKRKSRAATEISNFSINKNAEEEQEYEDAKKVIMDDTAAHDDNGNDEDDNYSNDNEMEGDKCDDKKYEPQDHKRNLRKKAPVSCENNSIETNF